MFVIILMILLCTSNSSFGFGSYNDLEEIKATCYPRDNCNDRTGEDPLGIGNMFSCSCAQTCSQIDACCINVLVPSEATSRLTCRKINVEDSVEKKGCFMMDRCPSGGIRNPVWKSLCEDEWNDEDDIMKRVPVTSLLTSITYKNYFCFRCNEAGQEFRYWNIRLKYQIENGVEVENKHVLITFNPNSKTWMAPLGKDGTTIPVYLRVEIPQTISLLVKRCEHGLISECANGWKYNSIKRACKNYMAIIYIPKNGFTLKYRNPHCALCNFETFQDLHNMTCTYKGVTDSEDDEAPATFTYLLDITHSEVTGDGNGICTNNFMWDPFRKQCRSDVCEQQAYMPEDGKCKPLKYA